jgi:hypothetical protein
MMAAVVGSALGAWWLVTYQRSRGAGTSAHSDRGVVIFNNTPRPADVEPVI